MLAHFSVASLGMWDRIFFSLKRGGCYNWSGGSTNEILVCVMFWLVKIVSYIGVCNWHFQWLIGEIVMVFTECNYFQQMCCFDFKTWHYVEG